MRGGESSAACCGVGSGTADAAVTGAGCGKVEAVRGGGGGGGGDAIRRSSNRVRGEARLQAASARNDAAKEWAALQIATGAGGAVQAIAGTAE